MAVLDHAGGTCKGVYMYAQWSGDKIPIIGNIRLGLEIYTQKHNSNVLHRDSLYVQDAQGKWEAKYVIKIVIILRQSNLKLNKPYTLMSRWLGQIRTHTTSVRLSTWHKCETGNAVIQPIPLVLNGLTESPHLRASE